MQKHIALQYTVVSYTLLLMSLVLFKESSLI